MFAKWNKELNMFWCWTELLVGLYVLIIYLNRETVNHSQLRTNFRVLYLSSMYLQRNAKCGIPTRISFQFLGTSPQTPD